MQSNRVKEMVGSMADLKKSPKDMRNDLFQSGTIQMVGSMADLTKRTVPQGQYDKHTQNGMMEMIASEADLNRTPRRGWQSYETPISDNSETSMASISGYRPKR